MNCQEYQQLFEEAPCYITVQGKDLKIIRSNREFAKRFSPEVGDFCYKAYKGRTERCEICPVMKTFEDGEPHHSEEVAVNKDGSKTYWMVKTSPIRNQKGEVIAAMEMSLDLTNVRALERIVQEKTQRVLEVERLAAVGETVAGLAHAIKNIASGLTGGMYVLEKGIETGNKTYLGQGWQMIKGNVVKIKGVAMDLLNYTKERRPECRLCDPNQPAREVYDLMISEARDNGIEFRTELAKDLPPAWFDPESIHRVLLNLISNAIDACMDVSCSTRKCHVILRTLKPEPWAVEYQVVDNGCGMDEEMKKRVFRLFFSTKGSRGTGLGLMISKKIVEEHGGVIAMESGRTRGTIFSVKLPGGEKSITNIE